MDEREEARRLAQACLDLTRAQAKEKSLEGLPPLDDPEKTSVLDFAESLVRLAKMTGRRRSPIDTVGDFAETLYYQEASDIAQPPSLHGDYRLSGSSKDMIPQLAAMAGAFFADLAENDVPIDRLIKIWEFWLREIRRRALEEPSSS